MRNNDTERIHFKESLEIPHQVSRDTCMQIKPVKHKNSFTICTFGKIAYLCCVPILVHIKRKE